MIETITILKGDAPLTNKTNQFIFYAGFELRLL